MKKFLMISIILFSVSIPSLALMPQLGIKVGVDNQSFEDMTLFTTDNYNDSLSTWWASIGVLGEIGLPFLPVAIRGEADYARESIGDSSVTDLCIGVSGKLSFSPPLSPLGLYLGAGPSLHILSLEGESENIYGLQLYAGINLKLGLNIFGEVGYGKMFPSEGSWSQTNVKVGIYF
jgi:hypothetical protein